jgi:hypothetical protein
METLTPNALKNLRKALSQERARLAINIAQIRVWDLEGKGDTGKAYLAREDAANARITLYWDLQSFHKPTLRIQSANVVKFSNLSPAAKARMEGKRHG